MVQIYLMRCSCCLVVSSLKNAECGVSSLENSHIVHLLETVNLSCTVSEILECQTFNIITIHISRPSEYLQKSFCFREPVYEYI